MKKMARECKEIFACMMAFLIVCSMFLSMAPMAGATTRQTLPSETIDVDRDGSLTVMYRASDGQQPLPQTSFSLYQVATIDQGCRYHLKDEWAGCEAFAGININTIKKEDWGILAQKVSVYAMADPTYQATLVETKTTNTDGMACFTNLKPSLYFLLGTQTQAGQNTYTPIPTFLTIPQVNGEGKNLKWKYDISGNVKYESYTQPTAPDVPDKESVTRSVLLKWDDDGHEDVRPESVTVALLKDGSAYKTTTLSAANNWRGSWENLPSISQYTVLCKSSLDDYICSVSLEGTTFVLTFTYSDDIEDPDPLPDPDGPNPAVPDPEEPDVPDELPLSMRARARSRQAAGHRFLFDITISDTTGTYPIITPPGDVIGWITNGTGSFELAPNQTFSVVGLPDGVTYEVTEKEQEGWTMIEQLGTQGTTAEGVTQLVTMVNGQKEETPEFIQRLPLVGGPGTDAMTVSGVILMVFGAALYSRKRKRVKAN